MFIVINDSDDDFVGPFASRIEAARWGEKTHGEDSYLVIALVSPAVEEAPGAGVVVGDLAEYRSVEPNGTVFTVTGTLTELRLCPSVEGDASYSVGFGDEYFLEHIPASSTETLRRISR